MKHERQGAEPAEPAAQPPAAVPTALVQSASADVLALTSADVRATVMRGWQAGLGNAQVARLLARTPTATPTAPPATGPEAAASDLQRLLIDNAGGYDREAVFAVCMRNQGHHDEVAAAFERNTRLKLGDAVSFRLGRNDAVRVKAYLREGKLRLADKLYFACVGGLTDTETLWRLLPQAHEQQADVDRVFKDDYAADYGTKTASLPDKTSSVLASVLEDELSDWELDKAKAIVAFGTLRPADEIRVAVNRAGTELPMLFTALQRSKDQVATVTREYQESYKEDLKERLDSELSGVDWKRALAWFEGKLTARRQLEIACEGLGTDVDLIWEALSVATPEERKELGKEFADKGPIHKLLAEEIDDEEMERVQAILSGSSDALTMLKAAGGFDGDGIMKAFKTASAEQLVVYSKAYTEQAAFSDYVDPKVAAGDQAHIPTILGGTPERRLRAAIGAFTDDEDYVFHVLELIRGDDEAKRRVLKDEGLMTLLRDSLSSQDFRRVQIALQPAGVTLGERAAQLEDQAKGERGWVGDAANAGDALDDELRELRDLKARAGPEGQMTPEQRKAYEAKLADTQSAIGAYVKNRDTLQEVALQVVTIAVGVIVGILTAGAGAAAIAAASVGQVARQVAISALASAVARVAATKAVKGDQFDVLGADGAIAFGSGAIDGVTNVLGAPAVQRLLNPAFKVAAGEAAKEAALAAFQAKLANRLLGQTVEGAASGGASSLFESAADESTWKDGFGKAATRIAGDTGKGILMGGVTAAGLELGGSALGGKVADGVPSVHPGTPGDLAAMHAALPSDLHGKVPIELDPKLTATTVHVHYTLDEAGLVKDISIKAGSAATAVDIALHVGTVRAMQRCQGLGGRVRELLRRLREFLGAHGEAPVGSRAWEAKLELEKLPRVLRERMDRLASGRLDPEAAAALELEIEDLGRQLERHKKTLDDFDVDPGRGFVAADAADQKLLDGAGPARQALEKLLKRTDVPRPLLDECRRELTEALSGGSPAGIAQDSRAHVIGAMGRAADEAQLRQALAELKNANRIAKGAAAPGSEVITHATKENSRGMLGLPDGIAPVDQADLLFKDAAGTTHLHEVKHTANAMANKLREESGQLTKLAEWQRGGPSRRATVVIESEAGWTDLFGFSRYLKDADDNIITRPDPRGGAPIKLTDPASPMVIDAIAAAGVQLRIGPEEFTPQQALNLRDRIRADMTAKGYGTREKPFGAYFRAVPTLADLARELGGSLR